MAEITPQRRVAVMCFFQFMVQIGAYAWLALLLTFMHEGRLDNSEASWITEIFYGACTLAVPLPRRLYVPIQLSSRSKRLLRPSEYRPLRPLRF